MWARWTRGVRVRVSPLLLRGRAGGRTYKLVTVPVDFIAALVCCFVDRLALDFVLHFLLFYVLSYLVIKFIKKNITTDPSRR